MLYHARLNIAQIALITGELDEAEARFIDCMQDKDSEPDAYYYLAIICLMKGEEDKAVGYVNIAIELDYRFYKKVSKQEIFEPIMDQIRSGQSKKRKYHYTYEEVRTKKHLDDTFCLIEKMKNNNSKFDGNSDKKVEKELENDEHQRE
jgi:tetratricopeptide (TPR) repeat protein